MLKKLTKKAMVVLSIVAIMSIGIVSNAGYYNNTFSFYMQSAGGKASSGTVRKDNTNTYAAIQFETYNNNSSYYLWYRMRSGTNDDAASDVAALSGTGLKCPTYYSGYGQYNYPYYFRIQTDTSSGHAASVSGTWKP